MLNFGPGPLFALANGTSELPSCCELILGLHLNLFKEIRPDLELMGKNMAFVL